MSERKIAEPVKTVLVITIGFLAVFLFTKQRWALNTAFIIGLAGIFSGYLARKIDYLWMKLSLLLGMIVPNILLSVVFFFLLTPLAFLSKIFGNKDPLLLKKTSSSLFKETNKKFEPESFKNPW
ncbi:MAG: hypothetical protein V4717_00690 [Bacteroidota bacterium]